MNEVYGRYFTSNAPPEPLSKRHAAAMSRSRSIALPPSTSAGFELCNSLKL